MNDTWLGGSGKSISFRGSSRDKDREELLKEARKEREQSKQIKEQTAAIHKIQNLTRRYLQKRKVQNAQRAEFDTMLRSQTVKTSIDFHRKIVRKLVFFFRSGVDDPRLLIVSHLLSMSTGQGGYMSNIKSKSKVYANTYQTMKLFESAIHYLTKQAEKSDQVSTLLAKENKHFVNLVTLLSTFLNTNRYVTRNDFDHVAKHIAIPFFRLLRTIFIALLATELPKELPISLTALLSVASLILPHESATQQYNEFVGNAFAVQVLTLPTVVDTLLVKTPLAKSIINPHVTRSIINGCAVHWTNENNLPQPIKKLDFRFSATIPSHVYLLANILSIAHKYLHEDQVLPSKYMQILATLLRITNPDYLAKHKYGIMMMADEEEPGDNYEKVSVELSKQLEIAFGKRHTTGLLAYINKLEKPQPVQSFGSGFGSNPFGSSFGNPFGNGNATSNASFELLSSFCKIVQFLLATDSNRKSELLSTLSNSTFLPYLWETLDKIETWKYDVTGIYVEMVTVFCKCYNDLLDVMDDDEFFTREKPFSLKENVNISGTLKDCVFRLYWNGNQAWELKEEMASTVAKLRQRDSRRRFCPTNHFIISNTASLDFSKYSGKEFIEMDEEDDTDMEEQENAPRQSIQMQRFISLRDSMIPTSHTNTTDERDRVWQILKNIPFVIPFETRVKIFQHFVDSDKETLQSYIPPVNVRREYIFEDGFAHLHGLGSQLKQNILVQFINNQGLQEAGIGQGVFKEFLIELSKTAFGAQYGLFNFTINNKIYPNPSSAVVAGENHLSRFEFLGKILGKAIYEKILVDIPFARFFLSKLLGSDNFVNDLPSLDPELHKNLMFLKHYEGDAEDLSLNFTITDDEFGASVERELVKNGKNIAVTNKNKLQYIYRVAHYRLNAQIKFQSEAFKIGLQQIIPRQWLQMFDESELFVLICGDEQAFDVEDMKRHVTYSGYGHDHPTIRYFWSVVAEMTTQQRKNLLKFITSSSRPPLLGFKAMNPPVCIRKSEDGRERLPTSATCMNLLRLPPYTTLSEMKKRLMMAIEHGNSTFELT